MRINKTTGLLLLALGILFVGAAMLWQREQPRLPVKTRILSPALINSGFDFRILSLGGKGYVYGAKGGQMVRIEEAGQQLRDIHRFKDNISAMLERKDGLLIVITDNDQWDPEQPCRVFRSRDRGRSFTQVKEIKGGSALWWSLDSDATGRLYIAEYGPQKKGMSKTLWRSDDDGTSWQAIYQAPDEDKVHLHRIAVDPYTDDLWLTVGDGKHRAMLTSGDHGKHWQQVADLQSTAVAFSEQAIYWGRDSYSQSGILRYDRQGKTFSTWLKSRQLGNYAGSIYDMLILPGGELVVPFMKYPEQNHVASVWAGQPGDWTELIQLASEKGRGTGFQTIAGPDRDGWVYMPGYQFRVSELSRLENR